MIRSLHPSRHGGWGLTISARKEERASKTAIASKEPKSGALPLPTPNTINNSAQRAKLLIGNLRHNEELGSCVQTDYVSRVATFKTRAN